MSDYANRLTRLRAELDKAGLDGFLVPMADEFQSEYVPASAQRILFLSGFSGSSGFIIVLKNKAGFFTDGRYTLQASQQLTGDLFEVMDSGVKAPSEWLAANTSKGMKIGYDPWLHTSEGIDRLTKAITKSGAELVPVEKNPVDTVWTDRPAPPAGLIYAYDLTYAGKSSADKRGVIATQLQKKNLAAAVITDPASVAWLLNVRGSDVPNTPLPLSYAIIRASGRVKWFVNPRKLTGGLQQQLTSQVDVEDVTQFPYALDQLGKESDAIRIDPAEAPSSAVERLRAAGAKLDLGEDPCILPKACKNPTELEGMRACHRRDGAALVKFFSWLEKELLSGTVTELTAEEKLAEFRSTNNLYRGPSFDTISGAGGHGAIVHYRATQNTNRKLESGQLYLLDSGGQYLDGTTDVTRTVAIGAPSAEMRDRFTRVLKGHIALASIKFPEGTSGAELDVLARQPLWDAGLDFNHGTGHGVGNYLGVHEGPQGISKRNKVPLRPGMVVSNEPGYYKAGQYGIRIENLQAVIEAVELGTERKMFGFETLTLAPIDRRLIEVDMLNANERNWINNYHVRVRETIRPLVDGDAVKWLTDATKAI
ncbi:MAG TPA: aminopeptidase P family protein [Alphaproteobacteria bacterium]|nr:aminopeptidase P family protein [Alphaproteobacteria bacterium]